MADDNQTSTPPAQGNPAPNPTAAAGPTPTTSGAPETGTAGSAAESSAGSGATEARKEVERAAHWGVRAILTEALTALGKIEHFTQEELDTLWKAIAAKL